MKDKEMTTSESICIEVENVTVAYHNKWHCINLQLRDWLNLRIGRYEWFHQLCLRQYNLLASNGASAD